jgi:hypothetical protein
VLFCGLLFKNWSLHSFMSSFTPPMSPIGRHRRYLKLNQLVKNSLETAHRNYVDNMLNTDI